MTIKLDQLQRCWEDTEAHPITHQHAVEIASFVKTDSTPWLRLWLSTQGGCQQEALHDVLNLFQSEWASKWPYLTARQAELVRLTLHLSAWDGANEVEPKVEVPA